MSTQPSQPAAPLVTEADSGRGRSLLLSGLGYYKLSVKRRKMLTYVFGGSLALHILALLIFGGMIIMRPTMEEATIFRTPPPARRYEPRELEHKVKVQKQQRSSSRPAMMPRMVSMRVSDLSLPEVKVDPKVIHTTFQPKFRAVSGRGLGAGLGTGHGTHGFGSGVANMNFFGLRARGERIAIIVDASISMAEETEELGVTAAGIAQYQRVKNRIGQVIDSLPEGALFNVIVYAETASAWRDEMQYATADSRRSAKEFLQPFNSKVDWNAVGHKSGLSHLPYGLGNRAAGGTTRFDLALSLAFKSGADTILIICDGDVWVEMAPSPEQRQQHQEELQRWQERTAPARAAHQQAVAQWQANAPPVETRTEKVWREGRPAQSAVIRERGGRPARAATEGRWVTRTVRVGGGGGGGPSAPRLPPRPELPKTIWTLADYQRHIEMLHNEFLKPKGQRMPQIHIIGFRSGREDSDFLRNLARAYRGQFRHVSTVK